MSRSSVIRTGVPPAAARQTISMINDYRRSRIVRHSARKYISISGRDGTVAPSVENDFTRTIHSIPEITGSQEGKWRQ